MKTKKLLSVLLVTALLLSMLPVMAWAQSNVCSIEGPRVESVPIRSCTNEPVLAPGNHERYLDRVASLPEYALEYYRWMEENACADGALADPTRGTEYYGEYYHTVTHITGSEQFTFTSREEMLTNASQIAETGLDKEFASFSAYVGVIQDVFDREHPEVFWLSGRFSSSYLGSWSYSTRGNTCTVTYDADMVVWLQYPGFDIRDDKYQDPKKIAQTIDIRDAAIREILVGCPSGTDYDRVAYLNDALTARNAYNSDVAANGGFSADSDAWECISALVGRSGKAGPVCEGYARAFQVLCDQLEIPCVLVNGDARSSLDEPAGGHMWNYVQIDGGWYAVDVTWNDPYVDTKLEQKKSGYESREWLLLGSDTQVSPGLSFLDSHVVTNRIRSQGLSFTNGPVLETGTYDPTAKPRYSISGTVTSSGNEAVTLQLWQGSTLKATQAIEGSKVSYTFDGLESGSYQLTVSKNGHVTRTQEVTLSDKAESCDLKLCRAGDVSGDGRLNVGDVAKIYGHIKKAATLIDAYVLQCADITGDGRLNVGDTARLYAMIRG